MSTLKEKFEDLFGSDKTIQFILLNVLTLTGIFCGFLATIVSLIFQFEIKSVYLILICMAACLLAFYVANICNKQILATCFITLFMNLVGFPLMYFVSGGINSGAPVWLVVGLLLTFVVTPGKRLTIAMFIIGAIGPISAVILGFLKPEWIIPLSTDFKVAVDVILAVILVSLMFGIMYKFQAKEYEKQKKQIEKSAKIAIEATKAKTNFLSNMTHDIRTPMNSIIGFTEIARKNVDQRSTLLESLSNISIASEHLLALVNDVLEMSRIERGKFELEIEQTTITSITEKVETILTPEMEDLNLHFIVDTSEVMEDTICCDTLRVTQILINVLSNAIKYSHPDGHIFLSVNQRQNPSYDNILCEIRIRDEGIGIGPDFLPHIFEPFSRENKSTVSGIPGSGLGLAITKQMLEMMKGTISATSEPGKGTEFLITIPFEMPTLVEYENQIEVEKYRFEGKRILIVEDNELNLEIVRELLEEAGFEVDTVRDGTYAIEKMRSVEPDYFDLILMDIQMPLMSGYEATEIIRSLENKKKANIPVIALTANAFDGDRKRAEQCGMNDFIPKPINAREMLKVIKRTIE